MGVHWVLCYHKGYDTFLLGGYLGLLAVDDSGRGGIPPPLRRGVQRRLKWSRTTGSPHLGVPWHPLPIKDWWHSGKGEGCLYNDDSWRQLHHLNQTPYL